MMWHEDFGDEPSVEDRMPFGVSPEEMEAVMLEALLDPCEICGVQFERDLMTETGSYEYYTMDLDPGTLLCADCYETHRLQYVPDDPELIDGLTPISVE